MARKPQELLSLAAIARATGRSRQALQQRRHAGSLPPADFVIGGEERETLLWKRSTLERAGVLPRPEPEET